MQTHCRDGLTQKKRNSIANALELCIFVIQIYYIRNPKWNIEYECESTESVTRLKLGKLGDSSAPWFTEAITSFFEFYRDF